MRSKALCVVLAAIALAITGCSGQTGASNKGATSADQAFGRLTIDELETKMAEAKAGKLALFIYDNNEKDRFESGHLPSARWVEHDNVQASDLPADKDATLVFYCANER